MSRYAPVVADQLTLSLGQWSATGAPTVTAWLEVDPRVFVWLVNKAAARVSGQYQIGLGTPPLKLLVEEE